ncbi:MAG: redox-sensing transcriptional repressor Rex [Bacillota bacterium]
MIKEIPEKTLRRLPQYLSVLKQFRSAGETYCSAAQIAAELSFSDILVRKDLALVTEDKGVPNQGRELLALIRSIESFLGYNTLNEAVLVGVGMLGRALLSYKGFNDCGVDIVLGFDIRADKVTTINNTPIYHTKVMANLIKRMHISIGIITVPKDSAQAVCDVLVAAGVKAIWNFAPIRLHVPSDIIVHNENMAESLALISNKLQHLGGNS